MRAQSVRRLGAAAASLLLLGAVVLVVERYRTPEAWWDTFLVGDPHTGSHVFQEKGCSQCHAVNGAGANRAPDLGYQRPARSTLNQLVTEMWNQDRKSTRLNSSHSQ